jgi:hypothetical protein
MANIAKRKIWFIATRGSYLPCSWEGWLTYVPFVGFLIFTIVVANNSSNNFKDALLFIFPQWIAAAVVMNWIASHKS